MKREISRSNHSTKASMTTLQDPKHTARDFFRLFFIAGVYSLKALRIVRAIGRLMPSDTAQMVKLVDTPASGAGDRKVVEVRVFFWAPIQATDYSSLKPHKTRESGFLHFQILIIKSKQGFTEQNDRRIVRPINGGDAADTAQMVKLVDTPASGAGDRKVVEVRVFFWAPIQKTEPMARLFAFRLQKSCHPAGMAAPHLQRCMMLKPETAPGSPSTAQPAR